MNNVERRELNTYLIKQVDKISDTLTAILKQTTATNGRVTKLEEDFKRLETSYVHLEKKQRVDDDNTIRVRMAYKTLAWFAGVVIVVLTVSMTLQETNII